MQRRARATILSLGLVYAPPPSVMVQPCHDSDGDGIEDAVERRTGTDPLEVDSDGDGIEDAIERRTGTDPLEVDSDGDGIEDGDEDTSRDGRFDAGESDPRRAGLFPGGSPHIPEPLYFDLVRGLGAAKGELEVNTLAVIDLESAEVKWAPEVEWAFARGYAAELELPFAGRHLESVKVALQGTLPSPHFSLTHGWQTFAEVGLDGGADVFAAYLFGQRPEGGKLSYLLMAGGFATFADRGEAGIAPTLNASAFYDVTEAQTIGIETNTELGLSEPHDGFRLRVLPQAHVQVSPRLRFQFSVGFEVTEERTAPLSAARVVLE